MTTVGQIEARACVEMNKFFQQNVGRGASNTTATFRKDAMFIHFQDVLTSGERCLSTTAGGPDEGGEAMVRSVRDLLVRRSRSELANLLAGIVGRTPTAVLHDMDAATGQEMIVFVFEAS